MTTEAATLEDDLDTLFRLHLDHFGEEESTFAAPDRVDFQRAFARLAFDRGWLRLWTLELGGEPAASWYGLRFGDVDIGYQIGRSSVHDEDGGASLGIAIWAHALREAITDGQARFDFGPGGMAYKYRFTDLDPGIETIAVTRTARGRLAVGGGRAMRRVEPLRNLLRRVAG